MMCEPCKSWADVADEHVLMFVAQLGDAMVGVRSPALLRSALQVRDCTNPATCSCGKRARRELQPNCQ